MQISSEFALLYFKITVMVLSVNSLFFCIASGYTVHDTLDIVVHDFKESPGLIIHHVVVSTGKPLQAAILNLTTHVSRPLFFAMFILNSSTEPSTSEGGGVRSFSACVYLLGS